MDDLDAHRRYTGRDSAENLIARAREVGPCSVPQPEHASEREQDAWLEVAFAALPPDVFDPVVLTAVDRLMNDSESVTVAARRRLVGGADRGARWRQRLGGQLENVLCDCRQALGLSPREIASQIGVGVSLISEIETGSKTIDTLTADQVAAWIRLMDIDANTALGALQRSRHAGEVWPASGDGVLAGFVREVANALGESPSRP